MSRIEDQVCKKILERAEFGFKKYGKTMERDDFSIVDWLSYLQEELMDAVVYIERAIEDLEGVEQTGAELLETLKRTESKLIDFEEETPGLYVDKKDIFERLKELRKRAEEEKQSKEG